MLNEKAFVFSNMQSLGKAALLLVQEEIYHKLELKNLIINVPAGPRSNLTAMLLDRAKVDFNESLNAVPESTKKSRVICEYCGRYLGFVESNQACPWC